MHRQPSPDKPNKLTVPEAAAIMDVDPQFLRIALRQGIEIAEIMPAVAG